MRKQRIHGLYVIVDPAACAGRSPVEVARLALDGGASVIQWRDKIRAKGEQLPEARQIRALCAARGATFIVNDHADLAMAVQADGVHLGQNDLGIAEVRPVVGESMIVGVSTNNAEEAQRAQAMGADYVAVGSIFPTSTKGDTRPASLRAIREVRSAVSLPVVAIGGISPDNVTAVVASGAAAVAVITAVCAAPDPADAAARLVRAIEPADGPTLGAAAIRDLVHNYIDAVNGRDRSAFLELFAEDGIREDPPDQRTLIGREQIGTWWDSINLQDRPFRIRVHNVVVVRQEAALFWSIEHQHDPGEAAVAAGIEILSFEDNGQIASARSYWSRAAAPGSMPRRVAEATLAALNAKDCAAYTALWAEDGMWQAPIGTMPTIGIENIRAACDAMMTTWADFSVTADAICASGGEAALAWTTIIRGTRRQRTVSGVDVIALDAEGRITSLHSYWEPEGTVARRAPAV